MMTIENLSKPIQNIQRIHLAPQQEKIGPLTSIRFGAAFLVVLYHTFPRLAEDAWYGKFFSSFLNLGFTAVGFFFVLSGFILATVYPSLCGRRAVIRFWLARVARIYPVYIFSLLTDLPHLLLFRVAKYGMLTGTLATGVSFGAQSTMLSEWLPIGSALNFPSWSVATEAFFYVFFPILLLRLTHVSRTVAGNVRLIGLIAVAAIVPPLAIACAVDPAPEWINLVMSHNPILRLPEFAIGILLAKVYRGLTELNYSGSPWLLMVGIAGWVTVSLNQESVTFAPLKNAILIPFFGFNILSVALCSGRLQQILSMSFAVLLGEASYALYLIHAPAWNVFLSFGGNAHSIEYILYIAATIAASIIIYFVIERPCRLWLRQFLYRLAGAQSSMLDHNS